MGTAYEEVDMIKFKNADAFIKGIEDWILNTEAELDQAFRGFCVGAFHRVVMETPQWSGNAASNWKLSVGAPDTSVSTELLQANLPAANRVTRADQGAYYGYGYGPPLYAAGDPYAMQIAVGRNQGRDAQIKLGSKVYISNSSESLSGKSYIEMLEANPNGFLRAVNQPGHMVERAASTMGSLNFKGGRDVYELVSLRLGDWDNGGML